MNTHFDDVKIFDAHAHEIEDISHHVALASCTQEDWDKPTQKNVYQGLGIHPWWIETPFSAQRLAQKLSDIPQSFVGEIGLDRSRKYRHTIQRQIDIFIAQLQLARAYRRPIVVHLVQSTQLGLSLLKRHYDREVFLHGYVCSIETIRTVPHYFFGFNPRNIQLPKAQKMIEALPLKQILIESDGVSHKETLVQIAQMIAIKKRVSLQKVCEQTAQNTRRWLKLL